MDAERAAVRAANLAFYRAFEALDLAAMERLWVRDASACCLHPGWPLCAGWDEVRASWATIFGNTSTMRFDIADERIDVRGGLAWVVCVERIRSTGPEGDAMIGAVIATNVFRSDGGAWKMVHHHGSQHVARRTSAPPPSPSGVLN
jgi:ketosteroid isomerase-like protein